MHISYPHYVRRNLKLLGVALACLTGSFVLGLQTAGDVQPAMLIEAGGSPQAGDMDGDGIIDEKDALLILEITQGYRQPTVEQQKADPNGDGVLSVDDAIRILSRLSLN